MQKPDKGQNGHYRKMGNGGIVLKHYRRANGLFYVGEIRITSLQK